MSVRRLAWALAVVAVFAGAWWLLRDGDPSARGPGRRPAAAEAEPSVPDREPPQADEPDGFAAQVSGAAGPKLAAGLRGLLRTDEAALRRAEEMLLDPGTRHDVRALVAVLLGTIGDSDPALLEALRRFADDATFVRAVLLALGATREPPDDDDIFDLGDRPWGVHVAGVGITVRREIDDPLARDAVAARLRDAAPEVRLAAAKALRHSVGSEDARAAFLATLARETDDDVAIETGEALAAWAATAAEGERGDAVRSLLARAGDEGLDGYRFRLEDDLARVPLDRGQREALEEYARASHAFPVRSFALTVLAGAAERSGAIAGTRALLRDLADADPDRPVRDLAARLLGRLPYDADTVAHLARLARADPEWSLRYTAVDTLGSFGADPTVLAALAAAVEDPDERVAARARELRDRLAR